MLRLLHRPMVQRPLCRSACVKALAPRYLPRVACCELGCVYPKARIARASASGTKARGRGYQSDGCALRLYRFGANVRPEWKFKMQWRMSHATSHVVCHVACRRVRTTLVPTGAGLPLLLLFTGGGDVREATRAPSRAPWLCSRVHRRPYARVEQRGSHSPCPCRYGWARGGVHVFV